MSSGNALLEERSPALTHGTYGLRLGATNGLVSTPARLFLSKHTSRRPSAAVLPSSGTRSVAPSPLTSRTSAVRNLSLRARSTKAIVTALDFELLSLTRPSGLPWQHGDALHESDAMLS